MTIGYDSFSVEPTIWVRWGHESESGQMVLKKVKLTYFDAYLWQTMWNHAKKSMEESKLSDLQGVPKKRSLTRLAPLEAPRLLIGLEISPKCYQILYIGQTCPFTHFNTIYGWFPPNYGPKYGPFKQNKFHCFRILYSTIFNNFHEKWTLGFLDSIKWLIFWADASFQILLVFSSDC